MAKFVRYPAKFKGENPIKGYVSFDRNAYSLAPGETVPVLSESDLVDITRVYPFLEVIESQDVAEIARLTKEAPKSAVKSTKVSVEDTLDEEDLEGLDPNNFNKRSELAEEETAAGNPVENDMDKDTTVEDDQEDSIDTSEKNPAKSYQSMTWDQLRAEASAKGIYKPGMNKREVLEKLMS